LLWYVYYCPKCDRTISKERLEKADAELKQVYGISKLSTLRCPVCDCEYIDLDRVRRGGEEHVGKAKKGTSVP
jgi:ssDNA-binding Zn-finger/Zn-ribbon topoisomerase 1